MKRNFTFLLISIISCNFAYSQTFEELEKELQEKNKELSQKDVFTDIQYENNNPYFKAEFITIGSSLKRSYVSPYGVPFNIEFGIIRPGVTLIASTEMRLFTKKRKEKFQSINPLNPLLEFSVDLSLRLAHKSEVKDRSFRYAFDHVQDTSFQYFIKLPTLYDKSINLLL